MRFLINRVVKFGDASGVLVLQRLPLKNTSFAGVTIQYLPFAGSYHRLALETANLTFFFFFFDSSAQDRIRRVVESQNA